MTYKQDVNFAGVSISTEIFDSFVSKNDEDLRRVVAKCDACVIVYDICDRNSFEFANSVATRVRCNQNPASKDSFPILLVGNKSDLEHLREVGVQEGRRAADKIGSCHFSESSAAESFTEVQKIFLMLFQLVNNSTTPPGGHKRRKKSLIHVKQMILDHYRRPPLGSRSLSLDGMTPLVTPTTPQPPQRPPKPVVTSSKDATKKTLPSKCRSLGTLSEHPAEAEECQRSSGRINRISRRSRRSEGVWWRRHKDGSSPDSRISSTTTDASLSDFSAADDDAFITPSNVTSSTATSSRPIKRKNLKIRLPANSDGESLEDDDDDDVSTPPNSAPLILNNSRFRFNDVITSTDDVITDAEKRSPTQRLLKIFFSKSGSDVTRPSRHDVIDSKPMFVVGSEEEDRVSCNDVMMTSSEASRFKRKDRRRSSLREAVGDIMRMRRKAFSNDNSRLF